MTKGRHHEADAPEQEITSDAADIVEKTAAAQSAAEPVSPAEPAPKPKKPRKKKAAAAPEAVAPEPPASSEEPEAAIEDASDAEPEFAPEPVPPPHLDRLQKILAQAGIASRRHAEELITEGRVQVNGQVVTVLGSKADPTRDHIRVDGKLLHGAERHRYFLLNKPRGYVTTVADPEGRPTVMQLFSKLGERLYPVGRLDFQSEGLLLVTNDGELANALTKAAHGVEKTYLVKVSGQPSDEMIQRLRDGVAIERGKPGQGKVRTAPARVQQLRAGENPWYEVVLVEGRNRELRKMFEEIGHHVEKIRRVGYGPLVLDIEPGKFRELAPEEVEALRLTAAGKLKPRRLKSTYMLPKEAGQSTEQRMAKAAAKRDRKFQRPYPRANQRDSSGWQPTERTSERGAERAPDRKNDLRDDRRRDRRPPARQGERPSSGGGGARFTPKPASGGRPRTDAKFRGDRPGFSARPRFDRRPPRDNAASRGEMQPGRPSRPFGQRPAAERAPGRPPAGGFGRSDQSGTRPSRPPESRPPQSGPRPSRPSFDRRDKRDARSNGPQGKPFRPAPSRPPSPEFSSRRPPRLHIEPVDSDAPRPSRTGGPRPPAKSGWKPKSGSAPSGKPGFGGRPKPAYGSSSQESRPSRPPFKGKGGPPRNNRSGPSRGGKRPADGKRPGGGNRGPRRG